MGRRRGAAALTGSPVLIGAVTTLVTIVAVFLAYNANSGLPFVPTYDVKAELPNAANLVKGNDVRIGGERVGSVSNIVPVHHADGSDSALITMKLEKRGEPLPTDSTVLVRPRSALGLKYVAVTPGRAGAGYVAGSTIPLSQARPRPVEIDQVLNMFDRRTRVGEGLTIRGFGDALTGRGQDLNEAIRALRPLFRDLQPVAANLAAPQTQLRRLFPALGRTSSLVAPVAQQQADLFTGLDTTFTALARVARPFIQQTISKAPPTLHTVGSLRTTFAFVTPAQTTCNYVTLWLRNIASLLSVGDADGTWQRFIIVAAPSGPNNEGGPSSAPANDPANPANHLHANSYPNTAAPGQTRECEAGNEPYRAGKTVIGNTPGNQGTHTAGQVKGQG